MTNPRVGFCWFCGFRLVPGHHATRVVDGNEKILHKECTKDIDEGFSEPRFKITLEEELEERKNYDG